MLKIPTPFICRAYSMDDLFMYKFFLEDISGETMKVVSLKDKGQFVRALVGTEEDQVDMERLASYTKDSEEWEDEKIIEVTVV